MSTPTPFHTPDPVAVANSPYTAFVRFVERTTGRRMKAYADLHAWSVSNRDEFWRLFLLWSGLLVEGNADPVCTSDDVATSRFFPNLRLNVTENILRSGVDPGAVAIVERGEDGGRREVTRGELVERVGRVACALRRRGVGEGTRVAGIVPNDSRAIVLCLAAVGLGATWSSVSPDMGPGTVRSRFEPLNPDVLITMSTFTHQGMARNLSGVNDLLVETLHPTLVIALDDDVPEFGTATHSTLNELDAETADESFSWPRFPFNHPLFILFSSGTTGTPKCIIHGAGGTLLEHIKEHRLHGGFSDDDTLYFHTGAGWMMWNWMLTSLASGVTLVTYVGSPTYPEPDTLWRVVAEEGVTVLGTSPTYLQYCRDAAIEPTDAGDLTRLRLLQSTGSVLGVDLYQWVAEHVGDVPLDSISGGTDIIGCFVLGCPALPTVAGESACVGLGLDVRAADESGRDVPTGQPGELVCGSPFPSRPLAFHADPNGERFLHAYFSQRPGLWTHGDTIRITESGGVEVIGRSDGVLNIRGIRIGPAELTSVVDELDGVRASMAVDQRDPSAPGGTRLVLFVVLAEGVELDRPRTLKMKKGIKEATSATHVPAEIRAVSDLPRTFSGKISLRAARDAVNGLEAANAEALANPEVLGEFGPTS